MLSYSLLPNWNRIVYYRYWMPKVSPLHEEGSLCHFPCELTLRLCRDLDIQTLKPLPNTDIRELQRRMRRRERKSSHQGSSHVTLAWLGSTVTLLHSGSSMHASLWGGRYHPSLIANSNNTTSEGNESDRPISEWRGLQELGKSLILCIFRHLLLDKRTTSIGLSLL
jgi:hypothetical protein